MHVHRGGSGAHRTAAAASSTRPQHGRTARAAASAAAAARSSHGRRSAAAGGCCGGAASCGGGLAAQPMSDTRHQHMSPGAAPTSKHLHFIVRHLLRSRGTLRAEWRVCAALFKSGSTRNTAYKIHQLSQPTPTLKKSARAWSLRCSHSAHMQPQLACLPKRSVALTSGTRGLCTARAPCAHASSGFAQPQTSPFPQQIFNENLQRNRGRGAGRANTPSPE